MTRKLRSITNKLSAAILLCLLLILWQAVSDLGLVPKFMFPSPVDVGAAFVEDFPILMANSGTTFGGGLSGPWSWNCPGFRDSGPYGPVPIPIQISVSYFSDHSDDPHRGHRAAAGALDGL